MTTIKTQTTGGQRRIITKTTGGTRRISCSCCSPPQECCMYRGTLTSFDDAPDSLIWIPSGLTFNKMDPSLTWYNSYYQLVDGQLFYEIRPSPLGWELVVNETINPEDGLVGLGEFECLIDDFNVTNVGIFDNFSDTYGITVIAASQNGPVTLSSVIKRQSLCLWTTEDPEVESLVAGIIYNQETGKWEQYDPDDINGVKQNAHNDPRGTYISGFGGGGQTVEDATIIIGGG